MASSEEDGTVDEKENNNKKRTRSALATAWLTFYNIAMTAGYVRALFMRKAAKLGARAAVYRSVRVCVCVCVRVDSGTCPAQLPGPESA